MTTQQHFTPQNDSVINDLNKLMDAPTSSSAAKDYSSSGAPGRDSKLSKKVKRPLRNQLLFSILPIVLLPLGIASAIGYTLTGQNAKQDALLQLKQHGLQVNETADVFVIDSFKAMRLLLAYPSVKEAISQGNQVEASKNLKSKSVESLEAEYNNYRYIIPNNPELAQFLRDTVAESDFTKILLTSSQGFNVASNRVISDVVQHDEDWWQQGRKDRFVTDPGVDEVTQENVLLLAKPIRVGDTTVGVLRTNLSLSSINELLESAVAPVMTESEVIQLVNLRKEAVEESLTNQGITPEPMALVGGETLLEAGKIVQQSLKDDTGEIESVKNKLTRLPNVSSVSVEELGEGEFRTIIAQFLHNDRYYSISSVTGTGLMSYASESDDEIGAAGRSLLLVFGLTALVLGTVGSLWISRISEQISAPIKNLAMSAQAMAAGDLSIRAEAEGAKETQLLAKDFNSMVLKVDSLIESQKELTVQQQAAREKLEMGIQQLVDEVGDALDGDLTVRASLGSMEMSTVADLFNAIIDSLADIATQVKQSTGQVTNVLASSETAMKQLAEQAASGSEDTKVALNSVSEMTESIQQVANNASQASSITDEAYLAAQEGVNAMDKTVEGIVSLRNTVGDTAKKMKRLGESSQKISQVVTLIDEIALKTNLLAINASVEASRAGEQGQGFAVVAEQVGALAEQSAEATKEISQIVAEIQAETSEVTNAMEIGTTQVVDTTQIVQSTKQSLESLLQQSQRINELMDTISIATDTQASTSRSVTALMQKLSSLSEAQSDASREMATSIQSGSQVAGELQAAVEQFKVRNDEDFTI